MEDNKRPHVVITDFGHAVGIPVESVLDKDQEIPPKFTSCQGTIAYFSPERLDDKHCWTIEDHLYVDIWPLGVILYEMVALEHPFVPPAENNSDGSHENGFNENESIKQNIRNVNLRFDQKCWHDNEKRKAMDIIRKILRKKPQKEKLEMTMKDKRPTIRQLMQHPFVVPPHDSTNHKRLQQAWLQYDRDELLYRHQIERLYDEMIEIAPISGSYVQKIRKGRQKDGAISMKQHDKERAEALEPVINEMVHLVNGGGVEEWMVADGKDTFDQDEQLAIEAQAARDNLDHEQQDIQMENGIPEEQSAPMMID
ncbi:kinase-like domain-containing protein [Phascolomyces articulosus]|uniref:Kinase-like domain-containing protein n=1 Tax=Phascolomyces articulosus TaxID=60185 RepID=A0AAD5PIQ4_9FUNG|nr:kinase-like domain-containing protein [Phascolomyces articulosus]